MFGFKRAAVADEQVLTALRQVQDPDLHRDIVSLGFVKDLRVTGSKVAFTIELTTPACPVKEKLEAEARQVVSQLPGVESVDVTMVANVASRTPSPQDLLPGVKNFVAVASGKGGVGKSTVAANLALALQKDGAAVGLLDADIYGPTIPILFGIKDQPLTDGVKILPHDRFGIKLMSIGFLLSDDKPVIWRGPLVASAVRQLLSDVAWGELDYLLIDLPPGTGDAQLTLSQALPLTGVAIVMTPQDVASVIATKALMMFQKMNVPILGIIENMSHFLCPHCEQRTDIFSSGGGERSSKRLGVPLLGDLPLDPQTRVDSDAGTPLVIAHPQHPMAARFSAIARNLAARVSVENLAAVQIEGITAAKS